MKLISFGGYDFAANGYWCAIHDRDVRGQWSLQPATLPRMGAASLLSGSSISTRPIPVEIGYTGVLSPELAFLRLLGQLDPTNAEPRPLVGQLNDGTAVQCDAIVMLPSGQTADDDVTVISATFLAMSPVWREPSVSTLAPQSISSSGASFTITNNGYARAYPTYEIGYSVQRSTQTSTVGWRYRKTATFPNNDPRTAARVTRIIDLGDTAALVTAGKALSSGDDVRVRVNGRELPRSIRNWNTKRTLLAVVLTIPAKSSVTVEIVYGNPSAGTPETLNTLGGARTRPDLFSAIDGFSTNGTATSGGASTLTDSAKAWKVDRLKGGNCQIVAGAGSGQRRRIASNTDKVLTMTRPWTTVPDSTSVYCCWMGGIYADGGAASSGTTTTITDSSQAFGPNSLIGGILFTAALGNRVITGNTATTITFSPPLASAPAVGSTYTVERDGYEKYAVDRTVKRGTSNDYPGAVSDVWLGAWYQDARYTKPNTIQTAADGIADAWQPTLMLRNSDDYGQKSVTPQDVGGGDIDYFNGLDVNRRVGSDRLLGEEGAFDGIIRTSPHGYDAVYCDFQIKNPKGQCTATMRQRADGGLEWGSVFDYSTTQASLTNIAPSWYDLTGNEQIPLHLYLGLLPVDEVQIPTPASADDTATMRHWQRLELFTHLENRPSPVVSAEEAIYDLSATIKLAALAADPPYDTLVIGGPGHYLHLTSTQKLRVTTDPDTTTPILALYDGGSFVREVSYAAVCYRVITDQAGNAVNTVSQEFLPIKPGANTVTVTEPAIGTLTLSATWREGYYG